MMWIDEIEASGATNGVEFTDEAEVRAYFTVSNMKHMFSGECAWTQDEMNQMADEVIEFKYHCDFS